MIHRTGPTLIFIAPEALKPHARNARTHSKRQLKQIAASIEKFGFTNPILVDDEGRIIAGHGRVAAARLLGLKEVPTLRLSYMTELEKRAYVIADNRLAEKAGWDRALLAIELQELVDLDFEVELTGFAMGEINLILQDTGEAADPPRSTEDNIPLPQAGMPVSQIGDLWVLGEHRLLCGDSREAAAFDHLMDGALARLIVSDPPYNVSTEGHAGGSGHIRHREFAMASGEMSATDFETFLRQVFEQAIRVSTNGSLHFHFMDWRHIGEMLAAGHAVYDELNDLCVWTKTKGDIGSLYRSEHELVFVWKSGDAAHINNVELSQHGRNRSNVWSYPGVNTLNADRLTELTVHPKFKPVAMIADAIKDGSNRGDLILDPFCGSGTILIAAEKTGRKARALEIDPSYVDLAVRRWEAFSGRQAILGASTETFEDVEMRHATAIVAEVSK